MSDQSIIVQIAGASITVPSAPITPNRPRWVDMEMYYPDQYTTTAVLYTGISDNLYKNYINDANAWENSCAIRMSMALNYSGIKLPNSDKAYRDPRTNNGVLTGKDGYSYWFRVKPLGKYLEKFLKAPDLSISLKKAEFGEEKEKMSDEDWAKVQAIKGIVMFEVSGWGNASGHFTLWNGSELSYASGHDDYSSEYYYFHMKYENPTTKKVIQTNKIKIWELK